MADIEVKNNRDASRYEATVDGHVAVIEYDLEPGNRIVLTHTEVPQELEGRGIAGKLVAAALDDIRAAGLKLVPQCAYVASYVKRHPEATDLLA